MNTVENTYRKVANTLSTLFGTKTPSQPNTNNSGKPSTLEMVGMEARKYHLGRNEWNKATQYTRTLVNAEYVIQTEFKINGGKEPLTESKAEKKLAKLDNTIAQAEARKKQIVAKQKKKEPKQQKKNSN